MIMEQDHKVNMLKNIVAKKNEWNPNFLPNFMKKINTLTPVISLINALAGYAEIWDSIVGKMPRSFTDLNVILFYM